MTYRLSSPWATYILLDPRPIHSALFGDCWEATYKLEQDDHWAGVGTFRLDHYTVEPCLSLEAA